MFTENLLTLDSRLWILSVEILERKTKKVKLLEKGIKMRYKIPTETELYSTTLVYTNAPSINTSADILTLAVVRRALTPTWIF